MGNTYSLSQNTQGTSFALIFKEWLEQKVSEPAIEPEQINLLRKLLTYASWDDEETDIPIHFNDYDTDRLNYSSYLAEGCYDIQVSNKFWEKTDDREDIGYEIKELIREWFKEYKPIIEQEYLKMKHEELIKANKALITKLNLIKTKLTKWTSLISKN